MTKRSGDQGKNRPDAGPLSLPASLHSARSSYGEHETHAFLSLAGIRGVGEKTLLGLIDAGVSFSDVLQADASDALPLLRRSSPKVQPPAVDWTALRAEAHERALRLEDALRSMDVQLIFRGSPGFPDSLLNLERPPEWLFVQGSVAPLAAPSIAIVGTRNPSEDGLFLARYVGACLGDWAAATVSGLAAGIDQLAHESSLRAGVPTVAVLGTGIMDDYPKGSAALRNRILEGGGTIISEYLPRASYSAANFVQRNRLQAALGRVLIPVEWARRSGTAHTVRFATELRRPIACLRLPDWSGERLKLGPALGEGSGRIFTVPRDQRALDAFVRAALADGHPSSPGQLSLFGEEQN